MSNFPDRDAELDPDRDAELDPDRDAESDPAVDLSDLGFAASDFPIAYHRHDGSPVPDLGEIPRERWSEVMAQVPDRARRAALDTLRDPKDVGPAMRVIGLLSVRDAEGSRRVRAALARPPALPRPAARRHAPRQVSFRLTAEDHARVEATARSVGLTTAQLARVLTLNGASAMRAAAAED